MKQLRAQNETDEAWERVHEEHDDRDSDRGRDDIYHVEKNEYGYPQTMQEGGPGQKDHPVCSCCYACVMPNRGQGTACDTCQSEAAMEMSHDYDMGNCY
jgi:hypothetical protein